MAEVAFSKPVEDSVSKVNGEVAVGEDIDFQRSWWRFERVVWGVFITIIVLDLAGVFGRGPVAHAQLHAADGTMQIKYDRILRAETPSILDVSFGPEAIHNGRVELYVSESLVKELGTQRVIPSPETTTVGDGGLTYSFLANQLPASVQFALQPSTPGVFHFAMQVPGGDRVQARVAVMP